jgi:hypothetical protein
MNKPKKVALRKHRKTKLKIQRKKREGIELARSRKKQEA